MHYDKLKDTASTAKLKTPWNASLDNRKPSTMEMPHIKKNAKKVQQEAERFAEVELENRVLLSKMSAIMKQNPIGSLSATGGRTSDRFPFRSLLQLKPGLKLDTHSYPITDSQNLAPQGSLNRGSRQRENSRIQRENASMLSRIVNRQPVYKLKYWEEQRARDLTYIRNIRSREVLHLTERLSRSLGPEYFRGRSMHSYALPPVDGALPASTPPLEASQNVDAPPPSEGAAE